MGCNMHMHVMCQGSVCITYFICEGQRTAFGRTSQSTLFKGGFIFVHCCVCQATWFMRFRMFSCFCLPPQLRVLALEMHIATSEFSTFWRFKCWSSHLYGKEFFHEDTSPNPLTFLSLGASLLKVTEWKTVTLNRYSIKYRRPFQDVSP